MKLSTLVFGILGVVLLAAIFIPPVIGLSTPKEINITRVEILQAELALHLYHKEYGQLPAETDNAMLVQILEGDNPRKLKFYSLDHKKSKTGQFLDGWGKPLMFKPNDTGMLMRSAGKDGIYYTKDDITQEAQIRERSAAASKK